MIETADLQAVVKCALTEGLDGEDAVAYFRDYTTHHRNIETGEAPRPNLTTPVLIGQTNRVG